MNALTFTLHLHSSCLFTGVGGGDPNTEVSRRYIPGSAVRGALVGLYPGVKDAADPEFRRRFLDGTVCYLNAYPLDAAGARMVPTPRSWLKLKDAAANEPITDFATPDAKFGDSIWKSVNEPFCSTGAAGVALCEPALDIRLHNAREDRQRPTSDGATLFQYAALAAGQSFGAVVISEDAALLAELQALLPEGKRLRMGRSRSAEYGAVEVCTVKLIENWQEVAPGGGKEPDKCLIVTLLSDAILRDGQGADTPNLDALLAKELGAEKHAHVFADAATVGGFNSTWNLPLPQTQALQAGSVFVYQDTKEVRSRLEALVQTGIGARTAEGYGRIALNWQRRMTLQLIEQGEEPQDNAAQGEAPQDNAAQDNETQDNAAQDNETQDNETQDNETQGNKTPLEALAHRILRARLDTKLLAAVDTLQLKRAEARNAQLSRLRTVVQRSFAQLEPDKSPAQGKLVLLDSHLAKLRHAGREQLEQAKLGKEGARLDKWLAALAAEPTRVWSYLGEANPPTLAHGDLKATATLTDALEYSLRLIDGILRLALKEAA